MVRTLQVHNSSWCGTHIGAMQLLLQNLRVAHMVLTESAVHITAKVVATILALLSDYLR